jgi:hypothetical protein
MMEGKIKGTFPLDLTFNAECTSLEFGFTTTLPAVFPPKQPWSILCR